MQSIEQRLREKWSGPFGNLLTFIQSMLNQLSAKKKKSKNNRNHSGLGVRKNRTLDWNQIRWPRGNKNWKQMKGRKNQFSINPLQGRH